MHWATGVALLQQALMLAVWLSLPLLAAVVAAGLAGGAAQGALGSPDPAALVAPKLIAAAVILALFGAWMLSLACGYWGGLWVQAGRFVNGG
jgi:flagellar biosynthesis protein FliQ